jgi:hypothetical protein
MKQFPTKLTPKNRHLFPQMKFNALLENWRQKTHDFILNNYSNQNKNNQKHKNNMNGFDLCDENNVPLDKRIVDCLILELTQLGWTTTLAYNGTVLFIYDSENEIEKYKYSLCDEIFE